MRFVLLALALTFAVFASGCKKSEAATGPQQGAELFANMCSRCHGATGTGGEPAFAGGPAPRNFHDHDFQLARTDEQIKMTIKNGKGSGMPAFGNAFDDAQLTALVGHVRSFDAQKTGTGK